jgi:ribosome-binding protein aMBF1 (putative translation factor)
MIRNQSEYREATERVRQEKRRLDLYKAGLKRQGLSRDQIRKALEPIQAFHIQLMEEVAAYERLRRGEFQDLLNLRGFGQLLVSLRISLGLSQRELAKRLEIDEAQVSRDERNEYHNIGIDRAQRILEVMGVTLRTVVKPTRRTKAA